MNVTRWRVVLLLASLCAISVARARAADSADALAVNIRLQVLLTSGVGTVRSGGSFGGDLAIGEALTGGMFLGDTPCGSGVFGGRVAIADIEKSGSRIVQWWPTTVRLVSADLDKIVVELNLNRQVREGDRLRTLSSESRTLTLREGEGYSIGGMDVPRSAGSTCNDVHISFQLEGRILPERDLGQQLVYNVWHRAEAADGRSAEQTSQLRVSQGEPARISFSPVSTGVPGTSCTLEVETSVEFRGRLRADGQIDLSVEPTRAVTLKEGDQVSRPSVTAAPSSGFKALTVRANEAVQLVLPEVVERFQNVRCGTVTSVDARTLLQGQRISLTVRVNVAQRP